MKTFSLTSLGCARNLVDSEIIAGSLTAAGWKAAGAGAAVDALIINTCGFIQSAVEESVDAIMEAAELKREGKAKRLVVCGCLSQRYKKGLLEEIPDVDLVVGTSDFPKISRLLEGLDRRGRSAAISGRMHYLYNDRSPRLPLTPRHYAYIKISEGCSNFCSYCLISTLRGRLRSRTTGSVLEEVRRLSAEGRLREIDLIGQDTTVFGKDRYGKPALAQLLRRLCAIQDGPRWIRVLYTHPAHYTDELIKVIRDEPKVCKYLDLPIQHISDRILKAMNRGTTKRGIRSLIARLRKEIPALALRTSVIVGFPGETEKDFKELLSFLRETRFERLGAFTYSKEEGSPAAKMRGQVSEAEKRSRRDEVMRLQQEISQRYNRTFVGKTVEALIDAEAEGEKGVFVGRTERDAPEVDGSVYVSGKGVRPGEFCTVKISDALEYDLTGEAS